MKTDVDQDNVSAVAADLQEEASTAAIMKTYPPPSCMDPQGYWGQMVQQMQRTASEAPGIAANDPAAITAMTADVGALGHVAVEMNNEWLVEEKAAGSTS